MRVQEVGSGERFSQDQLEALQYFHKFSFTHVLRLEKYPIKFDPTNAKTAFYIVPLNKCEFLKLPISAMMISLLTVSPSVFLSCSVYGFCTCHYLFANDGNSNNKDVLCGK